MKGLALTAPADKPPERGLRCPKCNCTDLSVYKTLRRENAIIRIRYCRRCGPEVRIQTREKLVFADPPQNPALDAARDLLQQFPQHVILWEIGHPISPNGYVFDARKIRCRTVNGQVMHAMSEAGLLEFLGQPALFGINEKTHYQSSAYRVTPLLPLAESLPR